jgi:N-acetylglucosamine kinase-like BadF-type ATPase
MKAWGVGSVDDLIRAANATPAPDFSALFPVIVAAAEAGDEVARQVLTKAGTELGQIAAIVIGRLFPVFASESGDQTAPGAGPLVPVATVGGVFRHASLVREVFYNEVRRLDGRAEVNPKLIDPVEGALRLARKSAGVTR